MKNAFLSSVVETIIAKYMVISTSTIKSIENGITIAHKSALNVKKIFILILNTSVNNYQKVVFKPIHLEYV